VLARAAAQKDTVQGVQGMGLQCGSPCQPSPEVPELQVRTDPLCLSVKVLPQERSCRGVEGTAWAGDLGWSALRAGSTLGPPL